MANEERDELHAALEVAGCHWLASIVRVAGYGMMPGGDLRVQTGFGPWSGFENDEPQAEYKDVWSLHFAPVTRLQYRPLKATDGPAAKLEALHIVGEWAKQVAVDAAELRGRMVGAAMNAKGAEHDG